jgi:hypothetical protein
MPWLGRQMSTTEAASSPHHLVRAGVAARLPLLFTRESVPTARFELATPHLGNECSIP